MVLSSTEDRCLRQPLEDVPREISQCGAWVGKSAGGPVRPEVVVAGVCQGKSSEEKDHWLKWGPTIETICGLDSAAAVARHYRCKLHLWIVSQEYANLAGPEKGDVAKELAIGDNCEDILAARYPGAAIFNTRHREHRGLAYAAASETVFSRIYPKGVRKPYGIESPSFWDQLDYSSCLGSMALPALAGQRVWAILDHDQLRPAAGAISGFPGKIAAVYYWPVPNLAWRRSAAKPGQDFFSWLRKAPRRMHRHRDHMTKLHLFESNDSLSNKVSHFVQSASGGQSSIEEILCYLQLSPSGSATGLVENMTAFRQRIYSINL